MIDGGDAPTIGHKLFNAATGTLCTTMQHALTGVTLEGPTAAWDGDPREVRAVPGDDAGWMRAAIDMARPEEADWAGNLSLPGYIHRFSTANSFAMSAFGMTPQYLTEARVGLSTFEFQLTFNDYARPGDLLDVETCIAHLGNTSMRFYHRCAMRRRVPRSRGSANLACIWISSNDAQHAFPMISGNRHRHCSPRTETKIVI